MSGVLALIGGDEFHKGNDEQDRMLLEAAAGRPAYLLTTAIRGGGDAALATAQRWFRGLGAQMEDLRVRSRADAASAAVVEAARGGGLFYIAGGDPGRVAQILRDSEVWAAIHDAWRGGAALAGSSAGAMALGEWTLVRHSFPGHDRRRPLPALDVVPGAAVLPHFDTFGERWIPSAREALGDAVLLGIAERTALLHDGERWRVAGPGAVTVIDGGQRHSARSGETVPLSLQPR